MKNILFWDIDGTLICGNGAGEGAFVIAMKELYGIDVDFSKLDYAGRTDLRISEILLETFGLDTSLAERDKLTRAYLENLDSQLAQRKGKVHSGIQQILDHDPEQKLFYHGLLTGNLIRGAKIKLGHFNLWEYFNFGGFADDSSNRNKISPAALKRAKEFIKTGEIPLTHTYVIGDTPHDIECGKVINAKTIAVATGSYSDSELEQHNPTHLFKDLSDINKFLSLF
jgi:phosphoglycolate phosphatase-like HAD superfamily hydrolase